MPVLHRSQRFPRGRHRKENSLVPGGLAQFRLHAHQHTHWQRRLQTCTKFGVGPKSA
ncbi:hypothetical protein BC834DRAFT_908771 [Gloeopeniophorella convolvens]|nr:hypothetical protein BC834DRAFT_908771 [Gloeopeniophorella convolvens]